MDETNEAGAQTVILSSLLPHFAWATDVHLNFISTRATDRFCDELVAGDPGAILLSGDIAEAPSIEGHLEHLAARLRRPIYFVLGNHDYYHGSIPRVRAGIEALCADSPWLRYLTIGGVVDLGGGIGLVGHDGWADGRAGDFFGSQVMLNDYLVIDELLTSDKADRLRRLQRLGDEAASHVRANLPLALAEFEHVICLTHVPPFAAACWHQGRRSSDDWLPHFTCVAVGDVLRQAAEAHPDRRLTVLCGHTHGAGIAHILPNLVVYTGGAEYGAPRRQQLPDSVFQATPEPAPTEE